LHVINFDDHVAHELARVSFEPQRRILRGTTLLLGASAVLLLLLALVTDLGFWPGLVFGILALSSGVGLTHFEWRYRQRSGLRGQLRAGLSGQQRMLEVLDLLDDRYFLLNNLKLPGREADVDHIVVGPNGVFGLETKNHRGRIFRQGDQWYQSKVSRRGRLQPDEPFSDPTRQLKRNIDYLRSCINRTDAALSRRTRLWIEGVVVFTHPTASLDLPDQIQEPLPFPVLRARDLPSYILNHEPRRSYSKADVRQVVGMFGHLKAPHASRRGHTR
jgi:hypothetical protein